MPDYAPNYTFRYRVRYRGLDQTHNFIWRFPATTTVAALDAIATMVEEFLDEIGAANLYSTFAILGASYALADSDVFLPASPVPVFAGTATTSGQPESMQALALSFPGRSNIGQRAIFYLYGSIFNPVTAAGAQDMRIHGSENANINGAIAYLNATAGSTILVANDGVEAQWYPYANVKYNDYWVRQVRL